MIGLNVRNINGRIALTVAARDSTLPVLSFQSAHNTSIHRRWPSAPARAVEQLCTSRVDAVDCVQEHKRRFIASCAPEFIIKSTGEPKELIRLFIQLVCPAVSSSS